MVGEVSGRGRALGSMGVPRVDCDQTVKTLQLNTVVGVIARIFHMTVTISEKVDFIEQRVNFVSVATKIGDREEFPSDSRLTHTLRVQTRKS